MRDHSGSLIRLATWLNMSPAPDNNLIELVRQQTTHAYVLILLHSPLFQ
jgi:hypothetical protein